VIPAERVGFIDVAERALHAMNGRAIPGAAVDRPDYANGSWQSVAALLKDHEEYEKREWTPERDSTVELMQPGRDERPSGISGIDPLYFRVKAYLMAHGRAAVAIMAKRGIRDVG
jgi:hypothetical protein